MNNQIKVKEANAIALDNPKMVGLNTAWKEAVKAQEMTAPEVAAPEQSIAAPQAETPAQMLNQELSASDAATPIPVAPQQTPMAPPEPAPKVEEVNQIEMNPAQASKEETRKQSPLLLEIFNDFTIAQKHLDQLGEKVLKLYNEMPNMSIKQEETKSVENIQPNIAAPEPNLQPAQPIEPQQPAQPQMQNPVNPTTDFKVGPNMPIQSVNVFDNPEGPGLKAS